MAGTLAALVRSMGKVASTAVAVTAQQNATQARQGQGRDLSKCTPCAAKAAVAAARAQVVRGQR